MTYDEQLSEFYRNRSKYDKIKPFADQWKVYGQTVVPTLAEALKVRGVTKTNTITLRKA